MHSTTIMEHACIWGVKRFLVAWMYHGISKVAIHHVYIYFSFTVYLVVLRYLLETLKGNIAYTYGAVGQRVIQLPATIQGPNACRHSNVFDKYIPMTRGVSPLDRRCKN